MAFRTNKTPVLQEKTASGSVASFNTALAMPLASCKIAVNAWQEGTGDPSPVNVRPIHGFSEVNVTRAGKNQFDISNQTENAFMSLSGSIQTGSPGWNLSDFQHVKPNTTYHFNPNSSLGNTAKHGYFDKNKNFISAISSGGQTFTTPNNAYYMRFSYRDTSTDIMLNFGSTATAYEPYVTPTIYTIQLGQEVYGAEVDIVSGVAHVTWVTDLIKNLSWTKGADDASHPYGYLYTRISDKKRNVLNVKCEVYREVPSILSSFYYDLACFGNTSSNIVYVVDSNYTNKTALEFKEDMGDYMILYELAEPFDIQLTPTQIETLIGDNNIFCDTGDTSVVFNDLDIAKRGSFREVFKLP